MFSKRLISLVASAKCYIAADVVFQWIALLANIALFVMIGTFLQTLLEGGATAQGLALVILAAIVAIVIRFACQILAQKMGTKAAAEAKVTIRQAVYNKLVALGPAYRDRISTSQATQISVEGVEQLEVYFGSYMPQLFYAVIAPITLFICLAPLCLPSALTLLICVPFIPASIMAVQKIAKRVMNKYWGSYTDLGATFLESIQGLTTLKIFSADEARHEEMNQEAEGFRKATMRLLTMQLNSITIMDLFAFGGAAAGIIMALSQFAAGNTTFGATFTLIFLSAEFFLPMRSLGSLFHTAMSGMSAADKMFDLLDAPERPAGTKTVDPKHADVSFNEVGYSYDGERTILAEVSLDIPQGTFVGITGASGSGKSTFAGILSGANANYSGTVSIGGIDLADISRESLRETVTYVPFASYLFKGTIRSNLALAKPNATDKEMMEALRRTKLDNFVKASGGLDAYVSPEGSNLSGGQRQRLAMARALLHNTPIYVLDEATSNIDAESEAAIIELAHEMAADKTVIMITHRLAALENADTIYVFSDGHIVETGTHQQLSQGNGEYARLWAQQAVLEAFETEELKDSHSTYENCEPLTTDTSAAVCTLDPANSKSETTEPPKVAYSDVSATPSPTSPTQASANASNTSASTESASSAPKVSLQHSKPRQSHLAVMLRMIKLTKPLVPVMLLAIALGVLGFIAAIFLTVFATFGAVNIAGSISAANLSTSTIPVAGGIPWITAAIAVALCGILRGPLRYGEQLCNHYLAFKVLALVRDKVFKAMRALAPAKLEGKDKGDLVSLVTSDVELLEVFYAHTISPAAIALIVSVGMVIFIGFQSPILAGIAAIAYVVIGIAMPWVASKASGSTGRAVRDSIGAMNTYVLDSLRGLTETLQFGRTQERAAELHERMEALINTEHPLKDRTAVAMAAGGALVMIFDFLMLGTACWLVMTNQLNFGAALVSIAALMSSFGPVLAVANLGTNLQQTLASGARVIEILDEQPVVQDVENGLSLSTFSGAAADHVNFSYGNHQVLEDAQVTIEPGEVIQITGPSGAGKSTLLKLFMHFWNADTGKIEVSGKNIQDTNTADLRNIEGFMTQDTFLFHGTIKDNMLIVDPAASDEDILQALKAASLGDLIERLPRGINTDLGELGETLSGGERQRLGLARIFLHDAPFVLLDEPTSNLDSLNESAVLRSLSQNRKDKTIVLVSHRPSTSSIADKTFSVGKEG